MTVLAPNPKATEKAEGDSVMNLNVIKDLADFADVVTLTLDGEFKATAGTPLELNAKTNEAAFYDITLPANESAFDLNVRVKKDAVVYMQAPEGAATNIGLLATWASTTTKVDGKDDDNHNSDDPTHHPITVKGLTIGEGIVVDAIAPQMGTVFVQNNEQIKAYGVISKDGYTNESLAIPSATGTPNGSYTFKNVIVGNSNSTTKAKVNTIKVFAGPHTRNLTLNTGAKVAIENLFVNAGASVNLETANVANIEGANKSTSVVNFLVDTDGKIMWSENIDNIESISTVKITAETKAIDEAKDEDDEDTEHSVILLNKLNMGLPAGIIDNCTIFAEYVEVYPGESLKNTTFKYTVYNTTSKKDEEKPMFIKVIPTAQEKKTSAYTYTFEKCDFQTNSYVYVDDAQGYFAGATPLIDPETGEWACRKVWHYAVYKNGDWTWTSTYDYDKDIKGTVAEKLGYVIEKTEYFYDSEKKVNINDIKDYDVTIALPECTVNSKPVTTKSGIYDIYRGEYDINEFYEIAGKLYKPVLVDISEEDDGDYTYDGENFVYLIAAE